MATGLIERAAIIRENHEFWVVLLAKAFIPIGKLPVVGRRCAAVLPQHKSRRHLETVFAALLYCCSHKSFKRCKAAGHAWSKNSMQAALLSTSSVHESWVP